MSFSEGMELQSTLIDMYLGQLEDREIPVEKILAEVIQDPQLFVFGELLAHDRVKSVNSLLVDQLRTMAYGSYKEYISKFGNRVEASVVEKIRMLTVLGIFSQLGWFQVPLNTVAEALGLSEEPILTTFKLLVEMRRKGLLEVKIDEKNQTVNVVNIHVFRDVSAAEISSKLDQFRAYIDHVRSVVDDPSSHLPEEIMEAIKLIS
jgi:hypothetical protein